MRGIISSIIRCLRREKGGKYMKEDLENLKNEIVELLRDEIPKILNDSGYKPDQNKIKDIIDKIDKSIEKFFNKISNQIENGNENLDNKVDEVNKKVENLANSINQKIDQIENGNRSLDNKVDEVNKKVENLANSINQRIDQIEKGNKNLDNKVDEVNKKVENLENSISQRIDQIEKGNKNLDNKVDEVNKKVDKLAETIERINQIVSRQEMEKIEKEIYKYKFPDYLYKREILQLEKEISSVVYFDKNLQRVKIYGKEVLFVLFNVKSLIKEFPYHNVYLLLPTKGIFKNPPSSIKEYFPDGTYKYISKYYDIAFDEDTENYVIEKFAFLEKDDNDEYKIFLRGLIRR